VRNHMFGARFFVTVGTLLAGIVLLHGVSHGEPVSLRQPLGHLPTTMDGWEGQDEPLEARIVSALGVSDYINRAYVGTDRQPVDCTLATTEASVLAKPFTRPRTASLALAGSLCAPVGWRSQWLVPSKSL